MSKRTTKIIMSQQSGRQQCVFSKKISWVGIFGVGLLSIAGTIFFNSASVNAISDEQKNAIVQNCTSVKASLKRLQKADSRTRVFLGTSYEHILVNFIAPLNVRLTKNNRPNSTLTDIQSQFASKRTKFMETYTTYMKTFDTLLATDCVNDPEFFYQRLESARGYRKELHNTAVDLHTLTNKDVDAVKQLRDTL